MLPPAIVGISLTTVSASSAARLGRAVRQALGKRTVIVAGGPLATYVGADLMRLPGWEFLDAVVRGEGEIPMLRLAEAVHRRQPWVDVPNLTWWDGPEVRTNTLTYPMENLDALPFPVRDQLEQRGGRLGPSFAYLRLSTSRGCTASCTFCNAPHARNLLGATKVWRGVSPVHVVDEVDWLLREVGCRTFEFVDSTFEDPGGNGMAKNRVQAIAEELLGRRLEVFFSCCMQAANWRDEDRNVLDLLRRAGLERVLVGIESGTPEGLARWRKRATVEDNERLIGLLRDRHVYVAFGFIALDPYLSLDEARRNTEFLHRWNGHALSRYATRLELYPGAEVVGTLRKDGLLRPSFDTHFDPFGYRFADYRVAVLAEALGSLVFGEAPTAGGQESPSLQLETQDVLCSLLLSRIRLRYTNDDRVLRAVEDGERHLVAILEPLGALYASMVHRYIDGAEAGLPVRSWVADDRRRLAARASRALSDLRDLQLRTGRRVSRLGVNLANIASGTTLYGRR